nr:IncI1 plasmid conjugative transfer pilus-tip adhesin protein PilV [Escherichia coli]
MRGDGMLTSKEAKNNANNHSLQACQSGTWKSSSASIWTNIKT